MLVKPGGGSLQTFLSAWAISFGANPMAEPRSEAETVQCEHMSSEANALGVDSETIDEDGHLSCEAEAEDVVRPKHLKGVPPAGKVPMCAAHAEWVVEDAPQNWVYDAADPDDVRPL